jgi:hypothetical protein
MIKVDMGCRGLNGWCTTVMVAADPVRITAAAGLDTEGFPRSTIRAHRPQRHFGEQANPVQVPFDTGGHSQR